ncbi:MAG: hypothetical protein J0I20_13325 [Chloroflexi bacterium]|nr:hypothetical protein [Chloroflexota bacterium]
MTGPPVQVPITRVKKASFYIGSFSPRQESRQGTHVPTYYSYFIGLEAFCFKGIYRPKDIILLVQAERVSYPLRLFLAACIKEQDIVIFLP